MSYSFLPPLLNEIADAAGVEAAIALAEARGGSRVRIPAWAKPGHWLTKAVGQTAADAICDHFRVDGRGASIDLPVGPNSPLNTQRRQVDKMLAEGASPDVIARTVRVHRTKVFRRKALLRDGNDERDTRQSDLFED